jgi:hypothetical protein
VGGKSQLISLAIMCGLFGLVAGPVPDELQPAEPPAAAPADQVTALLDQLDSPDFRVREAATHSLLILGESVAPLLRARLAEEADPEVRIRLRFVLDSSAPPLAAALVVRPDPGSGLRAGDVITHVNQRRINGSAELYARVQDARGASTLRVLGRGTIGPSASRALPIACDYRAPHGEVLARVLRLYDAGYAEQAYEVLSGLDLPLPTDELSPFFHAILAYTAGDAATAFGLLAEHPEVRQPISLARAWTSPSWLDVSGPQKAPFRLERLLWTAAESTAPDDSAARDVPVHRVLIPAGRFVDVLGQVAASWWEQHRPVLGAHTEVDREAGNALAVSAWMLSELDLVSECLRLIEPRSEILRRASQGPSKWLRVRTDAWLPFAHGAPEAALDALYQDARGILRPPGPPTDIARIQRPEVAATVAFFLYQFPTDERLAELFALVNQPDHPALEDYAYWMLFALRAENSAIVHEHLRALLPSATDEQTARLAFSIALLEYAGRRPDEQVFEQMHARLTDAACGAEWARPAAIVAALRHLAARRAADATSALAAADGEPGTEVLRATAEFLTSVSAARGLSALQAPLLAVPMGTAGGRWLVLTRDQRLLQFDAAADRVTPIHPPTPNWFPGPLNWPWLGRDPTSGRVWVYAQRRVVEVPQDTASGLTLNIAPDQIGPFDVYVSPAFGALADAVRAWPAPAGETAELWREDLQYGQECFADPDLPEVGLVQTVPGDERLVHVALRGGPQLLLDRTAARVWTSTALAQELELPTTPLMFLTAGVREQPTPIVFLLSNVGLLRLDVAAGRLARVPLPGDEPYPPLIPESCPYERRDPRWIYCARLPADGGQVYRVRVADNVVEELALVNEAIQRDYYTLQARAELRRQVDAALTERGLPGLREFVADAAETVARYAEEKRR